MQMWLERLVNRSVQHGFIAGHFGGQTVVFIHQEKVARHFVFYQETDLLYRKLGYLVKLGLAKGSVAYIKLVPYSIHDRGLSLLGDEERRCFLEKLKTVSKPLNNFKNIEKAWHGFLHCYGADGLGQEIQIILQKLSSEPEKGAAMLRNRLTTMQHNQHWIDTLTRIMHGDLEASPKWAYDLAKEWLTARKQAQGYYL